MGVCSRTNRVCIFQPCVLTYSYLLMTYCLGRFLLKTVTHIHPYRSPRLRQKHAVPRHTRRIHHRLWPSGHCPHPLNPAVFLTSATIPCLDTVHAALGWMPIVYALMPNWKIRPQPSSTGPKEGFRLLRL